MPVVYGSVELPAGFGADVRVEDDLLLEIRSVGSLSRPLGARVLTSLRMTGRQTGLPLNFNTLVLKNGLRRFVRGWPPVGRTGEPAHARRRLGRSEGGRKGDCKGDR